MTSEKNLGQTRSGFVLMKLTYCATDIKTLMVGNAKMLIEMKLRTIMTHHKPFKRFSIHALNVFNLGLIKHSFVYN